MIPVAHVEANGLNAKSSVRIFQTSLLLAMVCLLVLASGYQLAWPQQWVVAIISVLMAMWMDRGSPSYVVTLTLIVVSIFATLRYAVWRVGAVLSYFRHTENGWTEKACIVALLLAEGYAAITLLLGYMQTLWPLRRMPVALPTDPDGWPSVDVLIPTVDEPLSIVRSTALAAANIDWPDGKLNVYILDDGDREEFRRFAENAGIGYIAREGKKHAKAGNLNSALQKITSAFVAVLDCDHVPTRSFLQITVGWFLRDAKLGVLQTPQHLYSPDPFDRNLEQLRTIPNEGELFYGIVQDGNDFWNSALFCGSCAVLRRSSLDEVGGFAPETLAEDVHTSLRLQKAGWNTAYVNIPQAAGLATESLDNHVRQRVRWARGMIQILRLENPLFARGLTLAQRLCYFQAMNQSLQALPRLIFLAAPLVYLILGRTILPGFWMAILAFALPHLLLSSMANSRIQGQYRHSFWSEIYETILAPYILIPTLFALLLPAAGHFEVTPKGGVVSKPYFDGKTAIPFLLMTTLQLVGLLSGAAQLFHLKLPPLLTHRSFEPGAIAMYMVWALSNMVILGVCSAVAWESQQRRTKVRLMMAVPVDVLFADGTLEEGRTADISSSGVALSLDDAPALHLGEQVTLLFPSLHGEVALPATIIDSDSGVMRAHFDSLTIDQEEALTVLLYSRADTWLGWPGSTESDQPLKSLGNIVFLALHGLWQTAAGAWEGLLPPGKTKLAGSAARAILIATVFVGLTAAAAQFHLAKLEASTTRAVHQAMPAPVKTEHLSASSSTVKPSSSNLQQLPMIFLDSSASSVPVIQFVFLSEPSRDALKAAGIIASCFGIEAKDRPVHFGVSFGTMPKGNAIVILESFPDFQTPFHIGDLPAVYMQTNPSDPSSQLLLIAGANGAQTIKAAIAFTRSSANNAAQATDKDLKQRWVAMPDLRLFADTGYPFTRRRDLGETTIVVPTQVTPESLEVFLSFMERFGAQTGSPALNVTVTDTDGLKSDVAKDYLVLDSAQDHAMMRELKSVLPVVMDADGMRLQDAQGFFATARHAWWRLDDRQSAGQNRIDLSAGLPDALIEGVEWPKGSKRSLVVVSLQNKQATENFLNAYFWTSRPIGISQSVSLLHGRTFTSHRLGETYHAGETSPYLKMDAVIAQSPWVLVLFNFSLAFFLAIGLRETLRRRAKERLLIA